MLLAEKRSCSPPHVPQHGPCVKERRENLMDVRSAAARGRTDCAGSIARIHCAAGHGPEWPVRPETGTPRRHETWGRRDAGSNRATSGRSASPSHLGPPWATSGQPAPFGTGAASDAQGLRRSALTCIGRCWPHTENSAQHDGTGPIRGGARPVKPRGGRIRPCEARERGQTGRPGPLSASGGAMLRPCHDNGHGHAPAMSRPCTGAARDRLPVGWPEASVRASTPPCPPRWETAPEKQQIPPPAPRNPPVPC